MEKHINVVAAIQIGLSILVILLGVFILIVLHFAGDLSQDPNARVILSVIGKVLLGFIIIVSIPGIIAGIGLFRRKEWARILTMIISVIELLNFPVGTAVGIYSIWVLAQTESMEQFKKNDGTT